MSTSENSIYQKYGNEERKTVVNANIEAEIFIKNAQSKCRPVATGTCKMVNNEVPDKGQCAKIFKSDGTS